MGVVTDLLTRKHATLAKVVLPLSVAGGFWYTQQTGTHAITGRRYDDPAMAYTYRFKSTDMYNGSESDK